MYSGALNNPTPDNRALQFTDHFIWEQIFLSVILSHLSGIKVQVTFFCSIAPTNPTKTGVKVLPCCIVFIFAIYVFSLFLTNVNIF